MWFLYILDNIVPNIFACRKRVQLRSVQFVPFRMARAGQPPADVEAAPFFPPVCPVTCFGLLYGDRRTCVRRLP